MTTATGDAAINALQPNDAANGNPDQAGANAKLYDSAYGASGKKSQAPVDGAGATVVVDNSGQGNKAPVDAAGSAVVIDHSKQNGIGDVLKALANPAGPQQWQGGDLQAVATPLGMPERLSTGDTEIHEKDRDIIVMPKDEGSLVINKDGTYDLQLNKNSKEKAEVTQKDGVTTITFQPSGDRIQFDKDGLLDINRGHEGISWVRFDPIKMPIFGGIQFPPGDLQPIDRSGPTPNPGAPPQRGFPPIYKHTEGNGASDQPNQN
jgi:hypothetical protein